MCVVPFRSLFTFCVSCDVASPFEMGFALTAVIFFIVVVQATPPHFRATHSCAKRHVEDLLVSVFLFRTYTIDTGWIAVVKCVSFLNFHH